MRANTSLLALLVLCGCAAAPQTTAPKPHPRGIIWRAQQRIGDRGVPPNALMRAVSQRDAMLEPDAGTGQVGWTWMGPGNIGGRVRGLLIHPTQPDVMWAGAVAGGVWKTTDGGARWDIVSDFPSALGIGCMALDPTDPDRVYLGTGEGFFDTPAGSSILATVRGAGIFVSTDGGASFSQLPSTASWDFTNRIAIDPGDPQVLLAATSNGIFRSADRGSSWQRVSTLDTMDVQFHPTDSTKAVAGTGTGLAQYSTDGGQTWSQATGWSRAVRVEIHYWRADPEVVFAAVSDQSRIAVYRSNNGGRTYGRRTVGSGISTYSRYNNALWVDPTNSQRLLLGGVRSYRSLDGGVNFQQVSSGGYYDYHLFVEHPGFDGAGNRIVFSASDGGIHRVNDVGAGSFAWQELNNNLGINQFYGAAINPVSGVIFGGTQDQGTLLYRGGTETWTRSAGGDGGFAATDPGDPNYFYGESQNMNLFRSSNRGLSTSSISSGISESSPNFIAPFVLDPKLSSRMYAGGARLWRTDNVKAGRPSWRSIKPAVNCSPAESSASSGPSHFRADPPCNISAIGVGFGKSTAVWVGHNNGQLYVTPDGTVANPTWTRVDAGVPDRWVSRIAVDPSDGRRAYVSLMGYSSDNVWLTEDAGQSWRSVSGTGAERLPDVPVSGLAVHPDVRGVLFAGTDLGVFSSVDDGATWQVVPGGPFNVPVEELVWKDSRTLMAVTHGRGIYLGTLPFAAATPVGSGCGLAGVPALVVAEPALGRSHRYTASSLSPGAPVSLLFGAGSAVSTPLGGGCVLQTDPLALFDVPAGITDPAGAWSVAWTVPADPALLGAVLTAQVLAAVPGGPALGVAELTNGVELTLGW